MQPQESVINILQQRYNYEVKNNNDIITQEKVFTGISEIEIEAPINAVVYIKDLYDTNRNAQRLMLSNGYLSLNEKISGQPTLIQDMYFNGIHMIQQNNKQDIELLEYEYKSIDDMRETDQIQNHAFIDSNGQKKIYHNGQIWDLNEYDDMLYPIHVSVNYCYGLTERTYNDV